MKPHRTDGVSLSFGLIFLLVALWWAVSRVVDVHLPAVGLAGRRRPDRFRRDRPARRDPLRPPPPSRRRRRAEPTGPPSRRPATCRPRCTPRSSGSCWTTRPTGSSRSTPSAEPISRPTAAGTPPPAGSTPAGGAICSTAMTPFPAVSNAPVVGVGATAARALTAEFARHNAATSALVVGADHASLVVGRRGRGAAARRHADPGRRRAQHRRPAPRPHHRPGQLDRRPGEDRRLARRGAAGRRGDRRRAADRHRRRGPRPCSTGSANTSPTARWSPWRRRRCPGVRAGPRPSCSGRARCSGSAPTWSCATSRRCGCTGCGSPPADPRGGGHPGAGLPAVERAGDPQHAHRLERRGRGRHRARPGRAGPGRPAEVEALAAARAGRRPGGGVLPRPRARRPDRPGRGGRRRPTAGCCRSSG